MAKNHQVGHCSCEHTMKIEKEKMAEVRREEEKVANKIKSHEKHCGK